MLPWGAWSGNSNYPDAFMHSIGYTHSFITAKLKWDMAQQINQYDTLKKYEAQHNDWSTASKECVGTKMYGYTFLDILSNGKYFSVRMECMVNPYICTFFYNKVKLQDHLESKLPSFNHFINRWSCKAHSQ